MDRVIRIREREREVERWQIEPWREVLPLLEVKKAVFVREVCQRWLVGGKCPQTKSEKPLGKWA